MMASTQASAQATDTAAEQRERWKLLLFISEYDDATHGPWMDFLFPRRIPESTGCFIAFTKRINRTVLL